ncbi:tetratricopeptide repeat protein [Ruegeria aquimaris]|uniref:Tetratricopeptide repeat protein n=1 Tax=Ruegeria aquimaris TaxID=2984333 RepID=A0ABT3ALF4_9RHOB|nr:tetratricopeptide repeat protein [Ruegeria sp. XHP0148]MCV2889494.1 hypothetical protein [Ruegeria sp. XHP0148]
MTTAPLNLKGIVAAIGLLVAISGSLAAQQADSSDETALLAELAQADTTRARQLDRQLQALWAKSGSPSADFLLKRGRDALELHDYGAAIEHLTALTDHAPDFAEGWHARASAYFAVNLFGPAIADLEHVLALNPNHYNAIYGLGLMLEALDRPEAAFAAYSRALAIHPHHEEVTSAVNRLKPRIEGQAL